MELDDFKPIMAITPTRALWLANYGIAGSDRWSA